MKSPQEKSTIQIEITNACMFECSNCTRFCGHHKKPFFMEFETFKKAVDSMEGYPMNVGIMGGEPTLHPEFEKFSRYLAEVREPQLRYSHARKPTRNFLRSELWRLSNTESRRGLWTSLGKGYYKNFEVINDVYEFQVINDHVNPGVHQALLVNRKDLGIPDEEWVKLRDNCWVQNNWSSAITPKGAFFCEVAAALDMLFEGPGGWPIEKGWWKRQPEDFKDQLHWCELCSGCLDVPVIEGNRGLDFISPSMLEKLKEINSPKVKKGKYILIEANSNYDGGTSGVYERWGAWNLPGKNSKYRISETNTSLFPQQISILSGKTTKKALKKPFDLIDEQAFVNIEFADWVLLVRNGEFPKKEDLETVATTVFNPGCLYYLIPNYDSGSECPDIDANRIWNESRFILLDKRAMALRKYEKLPLGPELIRYYPADKVIHMDNYPFFDISFWGPEITDSEILQQIWRDLGQSFAINRSKGLLIFGGGRFTQKFLGMCAGLDCTGPLIKGIVDDNPKENQTIAGIPVLKPSELGKVDADAVFVATDTIEGILSARADELYGKTLPVLHYSSLKNHAMTNLREKRVHINSNRIASLVQTPEVLKQTWQTLGKSYPASGKKGIILFGGGAFTKKLLAAVANCNTPGPVISAIVDDKTDGTRTIAGIPVVRPEKVNLKKSGAVLICTDTIEDILVRRAEEIYKDIPILRYSSLRNENIISILEKNGMPTITPGLALPKTNKLPLVSITCFVKNRASMIRRCIDSVLNQDYPDIELVIQDGGSTDGTIEIIREYGDRIRLIGTKDNGVNEAQWATLKASKGKYIGCCLSDEEFLPGAISSSVAFMENFPDCGALIRDILVTDLMGNIVGTFIYPKFNFDDFLVFKDCLSPNYSATLFRSSALDSIGLQKRDWGIYSGDFELWCRLALQGHSIRCLRGFVLKYAQHAGQLGNATSNVIQFVHGRLEVIDLLVKEGLLDASRRNECLIANLEDVKKPNEPWWSDKEKMEFAEFDRQMRKKFSIK